MKITTLFAAGSVAALSLMTAAIAQTPQAPSTAPAARESAAPAAMNPKGAWRSSKLVGLDIYNRGDEKLGDINDILLDKDGRVMAVVIGVGGFLGVGEHDIAVSMDKLTFMEEPRQAKSAKTDDRSTTGTTASARSSASNDWAPDHAVMDATKDQLKAMKQFKYSDYN